eukprot:g67837.t1
MSFLVDESKPKQVSAIDTFRGSIALSVSHCLSEPKPVSAIYTLRQINNKLMCKAKEPLRVKILFMNLWVHNRKNRSHTSRQKLIAICFPRSLSKPKPVGAIGTFRKMMDAIVSGGKGSGTSELVQISGDRLR